ncbi:MAG: 50S ribosomal protein L6 [Actinomycetes bacterium]|jgi:large subunit ribosomal protein L6|nr:50S ribosomal protein L6 [Actinomycetes bacterium]
MSRIGKMPIPVPAGVEVKIDGSTVTVKGKLGELTQTFQPQVSIRQEDDQVIVERVDDSREARSFHGLTRTLLNNMVVGVSEGYSRNLEIVGVGYRATLKGADIELALGYSHPVLVKPEPGITFEVPAPTKITVKGIDKQRVGQVAADIRKWRKPEPYKGKGIRYEGEYVRRKLGKAAG